MAADWEDMLFRAVACQQHIYHLTPDWKVYDRKSIKYIKQDIGYAIYGNPSVQSSDINTLQLDNYANYGAAAKAVIDQIYTQILNKLDENDNVIFGIIFNIIFHPKDIKCKMKKDELIALPIFKVLRQDTTYYIDTSARVYTNWEDYLLSNKLPKCTMVYPIGGCYKPHPSFEITKEHSYVWLEARLSYECSSHSDMVQTIDKTINITAIALGGATLINPISSVVIIPAMVTSLASSVWNIGKHSADLIDRNTHEESISILNSDSLFAWMGIAVSVVNIGSNISSIRLINSVAKGETVDTCTTVLHDAFKITNVSVNLFGLFAHGYELYKKYQTNQLQTKDIIDFSLSAFFFANTVINMNFAKTIIEKTQGNILQDFEASLYDENMVKRYEQVKHLAATEYPMNEIDRNFAIIRYINSVDCSSIPSLFISCIETFNDIGITFTAGKIQICGITLIDPMLFIHNFIDSYINDVNEINFNQSNDDRVTDNHTLIEVINSLLSDFYLSGDYTCDVYTTIEDFKPLIDRIKNFRFEQENILHSIFNIAVTLLKSQGQLNYLVQTCCFLWDYMKKTFEEFQTSPHDTFLKYVKLSLNALRNAVTIAGHRFLNAIIQYVQLITRNYRNSIF